MLKHSVRGAFLVSRGRLEDRYGSDASIKK